MKSLLVKLTEARVSFPELQTVYMTARKPESLRGRYGDNEMEKTKR